MRENVSLGRTIRGLNKNFAKLYEKFAHMEYWDKFSLAEKLLSQLRDFLRFDFTLYLYLGRGRIGTTS